MNPASLLEQRNNIARQLQQMRDSGVIDVDQLAALRTRKDRLDAELDTIQGLRPASLRELMAL